jgi:4-amino-4-deoxy-L-arabinose transferase-like glycosyltransferase
MPSFSDAALTAPAPAKEQGATMGRRSREKATRRRAERPPDRPAAPVALAASSNAEDPSRSHLTALVVIGAVALAYRTALLVQLAGTPYLEVANVDSKSYLQWALDIAAGHWWPTKLLYQAPFYAYFLGVIYRIFGSGPWAPRIVQVLIGSVSPLLVYAIGAKLFSRRVGWIAGIALALYGPLVLEEITLSKTSPLVFMALAGFAAYLQYGPRARPGGLALSGAIFGLAVVAAAQWFLAFVALAAYAWFLPTGVSRRQRGLAVASFAAAGVLVFGPVVVWNSIQGGGLILTAGGAGLNLYSGNNPRASAMPAHPPSVRDIPEYEEDDATRAAEKDVGHPLRAAEVDRYWSGRAFAFMREHPADYAALLEKKLVVIWNAYEVLDNYHYAFVRAYFLPLLWFGVTFAVVGPFALAGLVVARSREPGVRALYIVCLAYLVTPVIYYIRGRYRLPAVPFLMVFGAVALVQVIDVVAARRWASIGRWAAVLLVTGVFVNHQHCEAPHDGMRSVCLGGDAWFDLEWKRLAEWYQRLGDRDRELAYVERALDCKDPRDPADTYLWVAWLESRKAGALAAAGKGDEATPHFQRAEGYFRAAIVLGSRVAYAHSELGALYASMHMPAKAVDSYEAARKAGATDRKTLLALGGGYADLGRCSDAATVLAAADQGTTTDESARILARCGQP